MVMGKGGSVVSSAAPILFVLRRCNLCTFKLILKDKNFRTEIFQALKELIFNFLNTDLPLTEQQRKQISSKVHILKRLLREKRPTFLENIILKNQKIVVDIILEPLESTLKSIVQE